MLSALLWAFTGALVYKVLATMMAVGHASIFTKKVIKQTLFLLNSAAAPGTGTGSGSRRRSSPAARR